MKLKEPSDLRDYQRYMVRKLMQRAKVLLAVDMGLGKTIATLTALSQLRDMFFVRRVLVIAPLRVASETWPEEIAGWAHTQDLPYSVVCGTPAQRRRALRKDAFITIINKENLQWMWRELHDGADWRWDVMVVDEASMLKRGRKRTKRFGRKGQGSQPLSQFGIIARAAKDCDRVIELTGTPAPEGLHNLWGLAYPLDQGERLGASRTAFEKRWFDQGYMGWDMKPYPHAEEEIMSRMKDLMISLRAEDHIKLPPVVTTPDTDILVTLPDAVMREYKKFERELFSQRYDVEAVSKGVLVNKLMQFANGSLYRKVDGRRHPEVVHVHDLKAHALRDLVDQLMGRPLLLAVSYDFDRTRIRRFLGKKVTFLEEAGKNWKKDWDRGRIRVLATHPASMSHGLNMQFGGSRACWYGLCHSGELYAQFNKRLPRPGQSDDRVMIYHILARKTWDMKALRNQGYKSGNESALRKQVAVTWKEVREELRRAA